VAIEPADLSLKEPPQREADWGDVAESLPKQLVGSTVSALANLARMKATESAVQREEAVMPAAADPSGWGALVKPKAVTRQVEKLAADRTAIADAVASANQAKDYLVDETPADMTTGQKAVSSLVSSAPPTALGIATGILTRNPAAAMAIAGGGGSAIQAGSTYGEALEHGADHRQASIASTIDAAIEGLDALPVGVALKPGSSFLKRLPKTMLTESGHRGRAAAPAGPARDGDGKPGADPGRGVGEREGGDAGRRRRWRGLRWRRRCGEQGARDRPRPQGPCGCRAR
jgi:hypothetical protein